MSDVIFSAKAKSLKSKAVIFDIDGTMANIEHRTHLVQGRKKNWKEFLADTNVEKDAYNVWCFNLVKLYHTAGYKIIFCSGRHSGLRLTTIDWLDKGLEEICGLEYLGYELLMRGHDDFREDSIIKEQIYRRSIEPLYDVEVVVDDRQSVTKKWRELGLVCLQCAEGNY
jgi:predicted secreted acid phosphatase